MGWASASGIMNEVIDAVLPEVDEWRGCYSPRGKRLGPDA